MVYVSIVVVYVSMVVVYVSMVVVYVSMVVALTKHYNSILFSLSVKTLLCCQNLLEATACTFSEIMT